MNVTREQRLQAIISLSALINSSLDPVEVRRQAVAAAMSLLNAEAGSLFLLDEMSGELYFEIALGEKGAAIKDLRLKRGEGIAGWVVEKGEALLVSDVRSDPRFCDQVDERSNFVTRSLICVPVIVRGKIIGALEAINPRVGSFTASDVEFLSSLAQQVAVAVENARLYEENSRQLTSMIDQERRHRMEKERLVKDLHDGIGGTATNISLLAEIACMGDVQEMKGKLSTIADLSREMVNELRTFMNTLESDELTWHDLAAEIRRHGTAMLGQHNIGFRVENRLSDPDGRLGMFLYINIFRIVKEGLANIVKHSGASSATVDLDVRHDSCSLTISDNGCGIPAVRREGRGVHNMLGRASDLHGTIEISASNGTAITVVLPLPFRFTPDGEVLV